MVAFLCPCSAPPHPPAQPAFLLSVSRALSDFQGPGRGWGRRKRLERAGHSQGQQSRDGGSMAPGPRLPGLQEAGTESPQARHTAEPTLAHQLRPLVRLWGLPQPREEWQPLPVPQQEEGTCPQPGVGAGGGCGGGVWQEEADFREVLEVLLLAPLVLLEWKRWLGLGPWRAEGPLSSFLQISAPQSPVSPGVLGGAQRNEMFFRTTLVLC